MTLTVNNNESTPAQNKSSQSDTAKWIVIALIVSIGVWGNVYFKTVLLLYRVLALIVLGCLTIFIALRTQKGSYFWNLLKDAKSEIKRVVWPTRQEVSQTTLIVVIVVVLMGMVLWGMDSLLGWAVKKFIS